MIADTRNLVSVTELSNNASAFIARAARGESLVVLKNNRPQAAIVSMEMADRVSHIDEIESDIRLLTATLVRLATDNGVRHDLDDVLAELDIQLLASDDE